MYRMLVSVVEFLEVLDVFGLGLGVGIEGLGVLVGVFMGFGLGVEVVRMSSV